MGKGGEKKSSAPAVSVKDDKIASGAIKPLVNKLDHLPTEDLRKWSIAYGVKEDSRESMLVALVSISHCFLTH